METEVVSQVGLLGQYELIGVMLALILLTGGTLFILYKIVSNHINHNTDATKKNTEVMSALFTLIQERLKK